MFQITFETNNSKTPIIMSDYRYKVHSAIYSCKTLQSNVASGYDVTEKVQSILRDPDNNGILKIDSSIINGSAGNCNSKCFAIIVTVVYPDGKILTRFCSCSEGSILNIKESGVVCSF